jgi:hypothetical protein
LTLRIRAYDHGRTESFRAISNRFRKVMTALGAAVPELSAWEGNLGGAPLPIASDGDADAVVAAAARMWRSGDAELVAYGPAANAMNHGIREAKLSVVAGIAPTDLPVWVPNQTELEITGPIGPELRANRERLQAVFLAVVQAMEPAWAVVEVDGFPAPPVPPFANGAPTIGWMTYLDRRYPGLPPALPSPSTAHDVGTGVLLVAHSSRPDRDAIERLQKALAEDVLLPATKVKEPAK